jgi:hypothetical protein
LERIKNKCLSGRPKVKLINLKPFTHLMVLGCSHEADQGDDKQEDAAGCDAAHNRQAGDDPRYPT